ncbi:Arfgef2, partial [Symbiodinium microadriaticum]
ENEGNLVKQIIILSGWGAQLISFDKYPPASVRSEERSLLTPRLTKEQAWAQLSSRAMTSMVLFLDYVRVMGDMLNTHYNSWSVSQLPVLMGTLQCCYDYARCFNAGVALRSQLKAKNFMRFRDNPARLPHLFEQETQSAAQILAIAFRLYEQEGESPTGDAKARLAEPIIKRITLNLSERYMLIDEASLMSSEFFLGEQLAAYAPPLMIAIKGLTDIKPEQFKRNIDWLSCFLSSISLCNDRMIRTCVKLVYEKQVNPLLVSLVLRQENSADE